MLNSSNRLALAALLLASVAICCANPADELEKEEARLAEKYEGLLEKSGAPSTAEERELVSKYVELSSQLEAELPNSDDVAENMEAASKLSGERLADAKSSFALLGQLTGSWEENKRMCSSHSEKILRLNLNVALELGADARVSEVIKKVSVQHARACQGVYATKYHQKLEQLDEGARAKLFGLFDDLDVASWMAYQPAFLVDIMLGNEPGLDLGSDWQQWLGKRVFKGLQRESGPSEELNFMVHEGPDKVTIDGAKFAAAYEQLVRQPCARFVELEADVFEPAAMDLGVSRAPLLKGELSKEEIQFAFGFFRYETCKTVLGAKGNAFEAVVKEAINY